MPSQIATAIPEVTAELVRRVHGLVPAEDLALDPANGVFWLEETICSVHVVGRN
jgi:hypothetical protein